MESGFSSSLWECQSGCSLINTVVGTCNLWSLFNVIDKNMVSMTNSDSNSIVKRNRDLDVHTWKTRNHCSFKNNYLLVRKCNKCFFFVLQHEMLCE